jgi:hypothetical protein
MHLESFSDFIQDKSIIIVGNSLNALQETNGEFIDAHDIVLRFGKGLPTEKTSAYLGSRTDIWVTGQLRQDTSHKLDDNTKILFNNSLYDPRKGRLEKDHLQMYSTEEIKLLQEDYHIAKNRRLSAGCVTSHWLAWSLVGWGSLTWINFDCFRNWFMYHDDLAGQNSMATSWHVPLLRKDYVGWRPSEGDDHPAHDPATEERIYRDILTFPDTYWEGEFFAHSKMIKPPRVAWTHGRSQAKK